MESGENSDGSRGYSVVTPQQQQPNSWSKSMGSPLPELQPKSSDNQIPLYYNTPSDGPASNAPSPYQHSQKSPAVPSAGLQPNTSVQSYTDPYRYQQHTPSPGTGARMTHRMPGPYPPGPGWTSANSPAPTHAPYMSPERGRYNTQRPPYPGYDPSKPYSHPPQPANPNQGPWQRAPYQSSHTGFADPARVSRFGHSDIAGPVIPAGLQALQANNNNAALMQHQHTPMLVPNPHYNQNRAQSLGPPSQGSDKVLIDPLKGDHTAQRQFIPTQDGSVYPSANPSAPNYYSTQSPRPQHHGSLGPIHQPVGLGSPSVSPYPTNPGTPGSAKGKARGNKSYQCPKCVKVFRRGDHLKRHLLSVHDHEHPYQCGECGKGFASVPTLLKHAKSLHIGNLAKGLMCLRCQLTFNSFQEIEAHAASLHVQEDEMYMQNINTSSKQHCCSSCSKPFTSAANLKRHMQLLHRSKDDARMYCRECGKGFTRIDMMRKHVDKMHNGNPSAMPEDLEDAETMSQEHSSESESRGPSADTDESSLTAPPSNNAWGSYPAPAAPHMEGRPATHGQSQSTPAPATVFQTQYQSPVPGNIQRTVSENGTPASHVQTALPPQPPTIASNPTLLSSSSQNGQDSGSQPLQTQTAVGQSSVDAITRELHDTISEASVIDTQPMPTSLEKIEPKSVSEALSMAMKALSDSNYETPGFEMYPYPDTHPAPQSTPLPYQRMHSHQQQLLNPQVRNGMPPNINGHRLHGQSTGMLPFMNNHNSYEISSRQSGNFLMTMPPPPGSISTGRLPPQPAMAGVPEAPQLSRLLQGGGGGVKIPTVINNNNNCNATRGAQSPYGAGSRSPLMDSNKRSAELMDDYEQASDFGQPQPEEKPDLNCNICKIEYENIDALMSHIEGVHLKQNPHECCICQKHFAQAGNVKRHIRFVHLRERPFRCKDCSCTFDRLCYLQRHMRTHLQLSEENQEFNPLKPCSCPECGKRCLTAHHLRGHMQRKHFAKNKQNYEEFLAKYGHLEALGTGPGAISQQGRGRRGRKRKTAEKDIGENVNFYGQHNRSFSDPINSSSATPDSSIEIKSLSNFPRYQCPPPPKIPPAIHLPNSASSGSSQLPHNFNDQAEMPFYPDFTSNQGTPGSTIQKFSTLQEYAARRVENAGSASSTIGHLHMDTAANLNATAAPQRQSVAYEEPNLFDGFDMPSQLQEKKFNANLSTRAKYRLGGKKSRKSLPYRCRLCAFKSFLTLEMLKSHMALKHKSRPKLHVCLKCGQSFSKRCNFQSHVAEVHKKMRKKTKTVHSTSDASMDVLLNPRIPLYKSQQQLALGYGPLAAYYPSPNQNFYGYDPNSPAMVPSPNEQAAYMTPAPFVATQMPLIQT